MKYLIDTHVLIYLGTGNSDQISETAMKIYKNPDSEISISQASFWEMAIKINIGKLHIPIGLSKMMRETRDAGIEIVSIQDSHIVNYSKLPRFDAHKDPFDRLIISIAQVQKTPIISSDQNFDLYDDVQRLW